MARKFERLVHYGQLKDGKLELANPRWFRGMMQLFADCDVVVTIERKKRSKSQEQLGYLWGVVYPYISDHTGHAPEELHEIFKSKFLRERKQWRGGEITTLKSTADMSTNEMAEFITNVIVEAAELGIDVPEPDKLYQFREESTEG